MEPDSTPPRGKFSARIPPFQSPVSAPGIGAYQISKSISKLPLTHVANNLPILVAIISKQGVSSSSLPAQLVWRGGGVQGQIQEFKGGGGGGEAGALY